WALMFLRLYLKHKYPDPVITPPPPHWQLVAAKLMHIALYLTFLALPLLGVAMMASGGKSWSFLVYCTGILTPDSTLKSDIKRIHEMLANIGYFLIAMHAAAALFHHYIQKDDTFSRMLPGKS
ncbi:cytochrome b, partial [Salmonella enterica]|uniref:cytochrome b n=1 Tax=Salmonella enterica TaxID=28901 RepID=UPI0007B48775